MSLARTAYEIATRAAQPMLGMLVRRRLRAGKEVEGRECERFARTRRQRPDGLLVWMHGASIGETQLLLETAREMQTRREGLNFLITCQTVTAASLVDRALAGDTALERAVIHQFAPIDTPAIARRFAAHWRPDLAIFAEGEIWPNLLNELRAQKTPTALINARMTEKSLNGWSRWPGLSRGLFGEFDVILAANSTTAAGLGRLAGRTVDMPGNLKSALPPPRHDAAEAERIRATFIRDRACLVAVSTHDGEEAFVLDALAMMSPRPTCIIVPRHPERAGAIAALLDERGLSHARRSRGEPLAPDTDVLLADTLGEVGLFARLADTVYLGGGHAPGVGGHNPLEILRLGTPVVTGPHVFNFEDTRRELEERPGYTVIGTPEDLARGFPFAPPSSETIQFIEDTARAPMEATVKALMPRLPKAPRS